MTIDTLIKIVICLMGALGALWMYIAHSQNKRIDRLYEAVTSVQDGINDIQTKITRFVDVDIFHKLVERVAKVEEKIKNCRGCNNE